MHATARHSFFKRSILFNRSFAILFGGGRTERCRAPIDGRITTSRNSWIWEQPSLAVHKLRYRPMRTMSSSSGWKKAYLALGANVGDKLANLAQACDMLRAHNAIRLLRTSLLYPTKPMYVSEHGVVVTFENSQLILSIFHLPICSRRTISTASTGMIYAFKLANRTK